MTEDMTMKTTQDINTELRQEEMPIEGESTLVGNIIVVIMVVAIFAMLRMNIKYTRRKK